MADARPRVVGRDVARARRLSRHPGRHGRGDPGADWIALWGWASGDLTESVDLCMVSFPSAIISLIAAWIAWGVTLDSGTTERIPGSDT